MAFLVRFVYVPVFIQHNANANRSILFTPKITCHRLLLNSASRCLCLCVVKNAMNCVKIHSHSLDHFHVKISCFFLRNSGKSHLTGCRIFSFNKSFLLSNILLMWNLVGKYRKSIIESRQRHLMAILQTL